MRTDICILLSSIIGLGGACVLQSVPKSLYTWADLYWNQCIFEFKFQAMQDIKMALILHPGLRDSGLDYPLCLIRFFFFFLSLSLRVCHCLAADEKATVPELCQAAEKYVCTRASTTCFYWKPRYWGKCLEFPRSSGFGESQRKERKSYPFSLPFPPQTVLLPGNAQ